MRLKGLDFQTWCNNHSEDHDSKWCRELYPYNVFRRIDFSEEQLNIEQKIEFNHVDYFAILTRVDLQDNGRYRTTFSLSTKPRSKTQSWKERTWATTFQIVYSPQGDFITVFTRKEDPSKDFVARFMKGNFEKISSNRSIPISELLFRTLLLHISEENFPNGVHYQTFSYLNEGIRLLPEHPAFKRKQIDFVPFYSHERKLWICYAFTEEKAHRVAFFNANQCERIIVVYCNPTYTKHYRCNYPNTDVVSLYEFSSFLSPRLRIKYEAQIKFLQNHLNISRKFNLDELLNEIESPTKQVYEIDKSDLMEALGVMKIIPVDEFDTFYSLSALNLINAWISRRRIHDEKTVKEHEVLKNMYSFKTYLSNIITNLISKKSDFSKIYIKNDLTIIEILGFQFSYHHIPKNDIINSYELSELNQELIWSGIRLQPVAPLVMHYARTLRQQITKDKHQGTRHLK